SPELVGTRYHSPRTHCLIGYKSHTQVSRAQRPAGPAPGTAQWAVRVPHAADSVQPGDLVSGPRVRGQGSAGGGSRRGRRDPAAACRRGRLDAGRAARGGRGGGDRGRIPAPAELPLSGAGAAALPAHVAITGPGLLEASGRAWRSRTAAPSPTRNHGCASP